MAKSIIELLTVTRQEFDNWKNSAVQEKLTDEIPTGDETFFDAIKDNEEDYFKFSSDSLDKFESSEQSEHEFVEAHRIIFLITHPKAPDWIGFAGLKLEGVTIQGELNLEYATVSIPLIFNNCCFEKSLILRRSKLKALQLKGTCVPEIDADEMHVEGSVSLCRNDALDKTFVCNGTTSLKGAKIEGNLDCTGGQFLQGETSNELGNCVINANDAIITSDVLLCDGFKAKGEINLSGASIGELNCNKGQFINQNGIAINANAAKIAASVSLGFKNLEDFKKWEDKQVKDVPCVFYAEGEINLQRAWIGGNLYCMGGNFYGKLNLYGATIEGRLDCKKGKFINEGEIAIDANASKIAASVSLGFRTREDIDTYKLPGFWAVGEIDLHRASIGGNLHCIGGEFNGKLDLYGATINGRLTCDQGTFTYKTSEQDSNGHESSKGTNEDRYAINANAVQITGSVSLSEEFQATGGVNFHRASIGGNFHCKGGMFTGALDLSGATIEGRVTCDKSNFKKDSDGSQDTDENQDSNRERFAINANAVKVAGSVSLSKGFEANGGVNLHRAVIGGNLYCKGGKFLGDKSAKENNHEEEDSKAFLEGSKALIAEGAVIDGSVFLGDGDDTPFKAEGTVSFLNATIDDRFELLPIGKPDLKSISDIILDLRFAKVNIFSFYENENDKKDGGTWLEQMQEGHLRLNGFLYNTIQVKDYAIQNIHVSIFSKIFNRSNEPSLLKWVKRQVKQGSQKKNKGKKKSDNGFALQPYEQLAAVLKATGHQEAATKVLIAKEEDRYQHGGLEGWSKYRHLILGKTIAYGYRPENALLWSIPVIAFGTFMFWCGGQQAETAGQSSSQHCMVGTNDKPNSSPAFNPFLYSVDTFIPIIDFHQERYWLPRTACSQEIQLLLFRANTKILMWYLWLHILLGWVLTSLWVAGLTGLVRNQK